MARRSQDDLNEETELLIKKRHQILNSWVVFESEIAWLYDTIVHARTNMDISDYTKSLYQIIQNPEAKLNVLNGAVRTFSESLPSDDYQRCWEAIYRVSNSFRTLRNNLAHSVVQTQNGERQSYVRILQWKVTKKIPHGYSVADIEPLRLQYVWCHTHFMMFRHLTSSYIEGRISKKELPQVFGELDKHLTGKWDQIFQYPPSTGSSPPPTDDE